MNGIPEKKAPKKTSAGRPCASDVEARTQNLIQIAFELFLQHGYSQVSLGHIAREAKVAVRTIYVKFGGKIGLLQAVIRTERERNFAFGVDMLDDIRPLEQILTDFGMRYFALGASASALSIQRMVIAEARANPELAHSFYDTGPAQTIEMLTRFFARPEIKAQFRSNLPVAVLPTHLLNCLVGNRFLRLLFDEEGEKGLAEQEAQVKQGVDLFLHGTCAHAIA